MNFLDFPEVLPEPAESEKPAVENPEPEAPEVEEPEEPEEAKSVPIEYDRHTLVKMIEDAREKMELLREYWLASQPLTYAKYSMQRQAYEMLLRAHDAEEERDNG
ncbi:hypothetical protein [Brotaphodocola sp.]|uniref:hypothetical protein n=1 Tax=Brotaphodocola sp. TaxID=3073577 RepID=UPI003D7DE1B0